MDNSGLEYERKNNRPVLTEEVLFKSRATFIQLRLDQSGQGPITTTKENVAAKTVKDSSTSTLIAFFKSKIDERTGELVVIHHKVFRKMDTWGLKQLEQDGDCSSGLTKSHLNSCSATWHL